MSGQPLHRLGALIQAISPVVVTIALLGSIAISLAPPLSSSAGLYFALFVALALGVGALMRRRRSRPAAAEALASPVYAHAGIGIAVAFVLVIGTLGLDWDLPWYFHPDSWKYVQPAVDLANGEVTEQLMTQNQPIIVVTYAALGRILSLYTGPLAPINFLMLGRTLSLLSAIGTVLLTFSLARGLFGHRVATLASLLLATGWLFLHHATWAKAEMPFVFATILTLWAGVHVLQGRSSPLFLAGTGVAFGLATSLKYPGVLLGIPMAVALAWGVLGDRGWRGARKRDLTAMAKRAGTLFGPAFLAYVAFTATFWWTLLTRNASPQGDPGATLVRLFFTGHYGTIPSAGMGLLERLLRPIDLLHWWLGPAAALLVAGGLALVLRRGRGEAYLATWLVPLGLVSAISLVQFGRYYMPLLPVAAIGAALVLRDLHDAIPRPGWSWVALGVIGVTVASSALFSIAMAKASWEETDPRAEAAAWLRLVASDSPVALAPGTKPWLEPPLRDFSYRLRTGLEPSVALVRWTAPHRFLVVPRPIYDQYVYAWAHPEEFRASDWLPGVPPSVEELALYGQLASPDGEYRLVASFSNTPALGGVRVMPDLRYPRMPPQLEIITHPPILVFEHTTYRESLTQR